MDFYKIKERSSKNCIEIYPDFVVGHVKDLLVRGKSFYAVWNEEKNLWSTDILDVAQIVDSDIYRYIDDFRERRHYDGQIDAKTLQSFSSGSWLKFVNMMTKYGDSSHQLDEKLTFANTPVKKEDYVPSCQLAM